jgi:Pentapeptide repeats (8 copies)
MTVSRKELNAQELNDLIKGHSLWLSNNGGERANLRDANLRGANLHGANLSGVDLSGADLSGATGYALVSELAIADLLQLAAMVLADHDKLRMSTVHLCSTVHCAAGWVCTINPIARTLEKIVGWNVAACIAVPIPEFTSLFYSSNDKMIEYLRSVAADNGAALRAKYLNKP